ncbi:hypothetical protein AYL99_07814 [Fonsecaea erecta]|uniref:Uncharacterized protein n=1 Tax=Fonsecaea erecta TaxID=1367422 RepID=A0A178ZFZ3_9EURO|nr:hypothetical protein AYL99_07814 [Fonsecaea erecta]OAP58724.1 hypothetical protein AYL99_07814 [Fonsecaea erecta]
MARQDSACGQTGHGINADIPLLDHEQPIREFYPLDANGQLLINAAELTADFQGVSVVVNVGGQSVTLSTNKTFGEFNSLVNAADGNILATRA